MGIFAPGEWNVAVKVRPLRHDPLKGYPSGRRSTVDRARYHPFNRCQASRLRGGLTQVASPPPCLPPLPAVSNCLLNSPQWRVPTSEWGPGPSQDLGSRRLSRWQVSTWPPRSTGFFLRPVPGSSGWPSVYPQIFCPPLLGRSVVGGGAACAPQGIWRVSSGGRYRSIPEPCSGLSYDWGPRWTHFRRDGDPSPGCNTSGTSPSSPPKSCSTSSHSSTMSTGAGGNVPTFLQGPFCCQRRYDILSLLSPSGSDSLVLKSLAPSSLAPRGCSLRAATILSIVKMSSGAR